MVPSLNSQMNNDVITLFRNGITKTCNPKCTVNNRFYERHKDFLILLLNWWCEYFTERFALFINK